MAPRPKTEALVETPGVHTRRSERDGAGLESRNLVPAGWSDASPPSGTSPHHLVFEPSCWRHRPATPRRQPAGYLSIPNTTPSAPPSPSERVAQPGPVSLEVIAWPGGWDAAWTALRSARQRKSGPDAEPLPGAVGTGPAHEQQAPEAPAQWTFSTGSAVNPLETAGLGGGRLVRSRAMAPARLPPLAAGWLAPRNWVEIATSQCGGFHSTTRLPVIEV